jgi:hypothetical protein
MGLTVAINSLKTASRLMAVIPVAGPYCEKLLDAAAHVCEVADVRLYTNSGVCLYTDLKDHIQGAKTNQEDYEQLGTQIAGYAAAVASKTQKKYGRTIRQTPDSSSLPNTELLELNQNTEELTKYVCITLHHSSLT